MQEINNNSDQPWIIFSLELNKFAIVSTVVEAMIQTPFVTPIPNSNPYIRGIFQFREGVVPLIDLRTYLGLNSLRAEISEFTQMMDARQQDHQNWLQELENSVEENREFKLTTNPHLCAFGKWYDQFKPNSHSLQALLKKFDEPHTKIHGIADKVKEKVATEDFSGAKKIIDYCRGKEFNEMVRLFSLIKKEYSEGQKEITIIFQDNNKLCGIAVDSVQTVERIEPIDLDETQKASFNLSPEMGLSSLAKLAKTQEVVFVVDHYKLIQTSNSQKLKVAA